MRFLGRGLLGLAFFTIAAALVALAGSRFVQSLREDAAAPQGERAERVYAVSVGLLERVTAQPVIRTHGVIESWRTLTLRAGASGRVLETAPAFRDGARARAGEMLLRIDDADYALRLADAEAVVDEARADAREARQGVRSAELERAAAETRRALRAATLERQRGLAERGVSASVSVEEAELALAAAEQEVASRAQAERAAVLRVERADLAIRRAELARDEARRALAETELRAPFDGLVSAADASEGDLLAVNQEVGALIDPAALEVAFTLSVEEFARLIGPDGRPHPAEVRVALGAGSQAVRVRGAVDRTDAVVADGAAGRRVFARLEAGSDTPLRPGDFVTVEIVEPPLRDVAVIEAAAATQDGRIYVLDADDRLRETRVTILRREGDRLIVGGAPFGARYVTRRAQFLAPGLRARPEASDATRDLSDAAPTAGVDASQARGAAPG